MPSNILIKRSSTASAIPTAQQLLTGELAINLADKKLYTNNNGSIIELGTLPSSLSVSGDTALTGSLGVTGATTLTDGNVSGDFTVVGTLTVSTPTSGTDAASKAYVDTSISSVIDSSPALLNTLNELAAAINDDPSFATTVANSVATKVNKAGDTLTGDLVMGGNKITSTATPVTDDTLTRKGYVDSIFSTLTAAETSATASASSAIDSANSATAASASATTATTKANEASTSATNAANSALTTTNAAYSALTSSTSSASSASEAAISAYNSESIWAAFEQRYLGSLATAPAPDSDTGSFILEGSLYWNSVSDKLFAYTGSTWVVAASEASATAAAISASAALTSKNNAAVSASAASASETASATSESNAATSAANALASETASATSETNSASSASAALTSETNSAASELAVSNNLTNMDAVTKADFFAQAEKRIRDGAGSGFAEWGKHYSSTNYSKVNQGLWMSEIVPNNITLGLSGGGSSNADCVSRSDTPITQVNGVTHAIRNVANFNVYGQSTITLPDAPDGTKTYDSATGSVVEHASAAIAFAAETTTNKVITSRQDFTFLESFHEKISDKDVVYPLGNVQYGASSWEGVTLSNTVVAQGYSAFGEWDTATKGYGVVWSTLSAADKVKFVQDAENNIYSDDGVLIQVRYRVRVVKGRGDSWQAVNPQGETNAEYALRYDSNNRIQPQGVDTTSPDNSTVNGFRGADATTSLLAPQRRGQWSLGAGLSSKAHDGLCFAIPIALVQRRNTGAYHPVYNAEGTSNFINAGATGNAKWYAPLVADNKPTSVADCFDKINFYREIYGSIPYPANNGRPDSKAYDAIYASDVQDLRMSSKLLPRKEIREKYKRMAIAGDVRGFESVPFTTCLIGSVSGSVVNGKWWYGAETSGDSLYIRKEFNEYVQGDYIPIYQISNNTLHKVKVFSTTSHNTEYSKVNLYSNYTGGIELFSSGSNQTDLVLIAESTQTHKQASPTWTDIIGSPANIAATFPQGVEGQWIPVIPDGVSKAYLANRKMLTVLNKTITTDAGVSWGAGTPTYGINTTSNTFTDTLPANIILLMGYTTQAHFTEDDVNSKVLDLGDVYGGNYRATVSILGSSLLGKVFTNTAGVPNVDLVLKTSSVSFGDSKLINVGGYEPTHETINLGISNNSPAVKTLDYLSAENSVAKLMYAYKEMVYSSNHDNVADFATRNSSSSYAYSAVGSIYYFNSGLYQGRTYILRLNLGTTSIDTNFHENPDGSLYSNSTGGLALELWDGNGFGDNNQFEITNNQATQTDDNGNTVLYGTASFNTQYFITEE